MELCVSIEAETGQVTQRLAQAKVNEIGALSERKKHSAVTYVMKIDKAELHNPNAC